ncbi:MAG: ribonuclease Z [Candidatus Moranbacteria bacterium]|nr:ribonuclease Z [Candidatus Moranbacteria bacterium]
MKINFLGTNGWYSTPTGDTSCILIETKGEYIFLDAGEGFYKADKYVKDERPVYLFLSHLHFDHIYGLHILPRMDFVKDLKILVPNGKKNDLEKILGSPYTADFPGQIVPIIEGSGKEASFAWECQKMIHQDDSYGFRLKIDGKTIVYTADTAFCQAAIELSKNCDMLIHECTNKPNHKDGGWGHSNPQEAAEVAVKASAGKLILTHFMPDFYPDQKSRQVAEIEAKKIFKNTQMAFDGLEIEMR